jgi:hypothetical protein
VIRAIVLVLAVAACNGQPPAPWSPTNNAESVRVVDRVVYRVMPDARIEITLSVTMDDTWAPGSVRVAGTLDSAPASPHVRLARARAYLALSDAFRAARPKLAFEAAHRAFDEIGIVVDSRFRDGHSDWRVTNAKLLLDTDPTKAAREMAIIAKHRVVRYVRLWHREAD